MNKLPSTCELQILSFRKYRDFFPFFKLLNLRVLCEMSEEAIDKFVILEGTGIQKWIEICPATWFDESSNISWWPEFKNKNNSLAKLAGYVRKSVIPRSDDSEKTEWISHPCKLIRRCSK